MLTRWLGRTLDGFAAWFASAAGVLQTFVVTITIFVVEVWKPNLDPQHFLFLLWLTIYSGVTQPILAFVSSRDSRAAASKMEHVLQLEEEALHDLHGGS
ncbi:hypothetical protein GCM10023147_37200 [Tsukamurella soli]|uniref:Uncharacterized protein n=2 Tax=Tsukamurella soli TaxID=644556 RepID=A0ABP8K3I0_9ACTN